MASARAAGRRWRGPKRRPEAVSLTVDASRIVFSNAGDDRVELALQSPAGLIEASGVRWSDACAIPVLRGGGGWGCMPTQLIDWSSGAAPLDKGRGDPFAGASAAEKLCEGGSGEAVGRDRREEGKHGEALA